MALYLVPITASRLHNGQLEALIFAALLLHRETIARVTGGMKVKADRDEVRRLENDTKWCQVRVYAPPSLSLSCVAGVSICGHVGCTGRSCPV